jgi:CHAT domain-containing protein
MAAATEEAGRGYKDFHNISAEWAWKFKILRAQALYGRDMNSEVLTLLASETIAPPTSELTVKKERLEGQAYTGLHEFVEAEKRLGDAERLCKDSDSTACTDVLSARGVLEMKRGHYDQAQGFFARAFPRARASGDKFWEASALLDLSWSANEQAHFDEALDWSDAARKISVERSFPDLAQGALGNMGWAYYKLGDSEKAQAMFGEAREQAEKLGDIADQVKWLLDVGYVYLDTRNFVAAERAYTQSLGLAEKIKSREDVINALQALAFVSEQTGKLDDAKRYADEALSMARADGNKRDEVYPLLVHGRIAAQQHDPAAAETAFRHVANSKDSPVFLKWEAERSLARLFEDQNQIDAADREYRTALSTFESARSELRHETSQLPFLSNASRIYDDYIHFLVAKGKTAQALQVAEYGRARTLTEGLGLLRKGTAFNPDPLNAQEIARRAGGTILFYSLGEKQSYLWAITPKKTKLFSLPPASEINAAAQRYAKSLIGSRDVLETTDDDGIALYRTLVAPAENLLPKDAKVFIIPDGSLNALNFETLLAPAPKLHYWIEDATISDASSLRLLAASRHIKSETADDLLLFGDAISPGPDYPPLPKAAVEMESIAKHFPPAQQQAFSREHATPPSYLTSKAEEFSYIHFVAHGTASRLSPLDSAIVLSKATAEDDSFKLYARDIIHHPLRADLVTISTCYGAAGRSYSGEGLVGLSWAFLRAGAHNVIGALWEVSDVSTPQLMDDLYSELKKGNSPDAALRSAKLSLLHSTSAFRKPFYWAPFQLYTGS